MKRALSNFMFVLLLVSLLTMAPSIQPVKAEPTAIIVPNDYPTIQEAVNAANPGDTVFVSSGIYVLNSTLTIPFAKRSITLEGAGFSTVLKAKALLNATLIAAYASGLSIVSMTIDGNKAQQTVANTALLMHEVQDAFIENLQIVNSSGFGLHLRYWAPAPRAIVRNVRVEDAGGIALVVDGHAQDILLEDVTITNGESRGLLVNTAGGTMKNIRLRRIFVYDTGWTGEGWYGSGTGIQFDGTWGGRGEDIVVEDAIVDTPGDWGIWILGEAWNGVYVSNCTVKNNRDADGFGFGQIKNLTITNCTSIGSHIDGFAFGDIGLPTVDSVAIRGCRAIDSGLSTGGKGFMLYRVMNSSIVNSETSGTGGAGFFLRGSQNNEFIGVRSKNTIGYLEKEAGIMLLSDLEPIPTGSNNNTIINSVLSENQYGISIDVYPSTSHSSNNTSYHNNFLNNTVSTYILGPSANAWDNGYTLGGNYWSDYAGSDVYSGQYQNETGSDGIGDTSYVIDGNNRDDYPLMKPWSSSWDLGFTAPTGHPIVDFAVYNGSLYAAADNRLYVKDGSSWNVIGTPAFVTSLEPSGGKLVVGGQGGLYGYDGTSFSLIFSVPTYIGVLGAYSNTLYAGTMLDNPPALYYCNGSADNPADWHMATDFSSVMGFSGPFGSIDSFAVYDNVMYVGSGGRLFSYNGIGWSVATSYGDVYAFLDMHVYDGKLYLTTRDQGWRKPLYQGGTGFSGRLIEFDGENWTTVLDHDYWVYSLEVYNGKLYAGTANKILTYNGTDWETSFNATEGAYYAVSMITFEGKIFAGMGNGYIFVDPASAKAEHETIIVPEFPSTAILAVFMALTMLAATLTRKNRNKRPD